MKTFKDVLRQMSKKQPKLYELWNYLWLESNDQGEVDFRYNELMTFFSCSRTSMARMLQPENIEGFNEFVSIQKVAPSTYQAIINYQPKKHTPPKETAKKTRNTLITGEYADFLERYYNKIGFINLDFNKKKRDLESILLKITTIMQNNQTPISDETRFENFQMIMNNIPQWWVDKGMVDLPSVNKHFTKIINAIKIKQHGELNSTRPDAEPIDFSQFTN